MSGNVSGRAIGKMVATLAVMVAAGLAFTACATANRATVKRGKADTARFVAAGEYQKAIDLQMALRRSDPGNRKITAGYIAIVEEIKSAGDAARGRADYAAAAATYSVLLDSWDADKAVTGALRFGKGDLDAGLRYCRNAIREQEVRRELKAGNYEKAVEICRAGLVEQPAEKSLRSVYASAILEIKAAGVKALAGRDYVAAGRIEALLLKNVASFQGLEGLGKASSASLKKERLIETLKICSQGLTNRGLTEYRKGNLEKAIEIWEGLLAFDPGNAEIKKAVETAKAQLGKVKRVGVGPQHHADIQ